MAGRGIVAAGHPLTAEAGAGVLRAGGNAVDAALAALLASFMTEPLLTGLGAGGYMLVAPPGGEPVLLDFMVEAPGRGADPAARGALEAVLVDFGDAVQTFHIGGPSCGVYGLPAGVAAAASRFGSLDLQELVAPAVALARGGVEVNRQQAYLWTLLEPIVVATPESRARYCDGARVPREGDVLRDPELADALERLAADGAAPFYTGDVGAAVSDAVLAAGGLLTRADLAAYDAVPREPVRVSYRGRDVLTNPPPSAGGILIAYALALLERSDPDHPPAVAELVRAMAAAQAERTPEFLEGLAAPGFRERFLASRLGSTTHVSVLDADGWACAVTSTNGEGSGLVVPGTGVHVNNMMGEQDLSPLGWFTYPPGRRLPSMMAPTVVMSGGAPELVLGSAGSNRIRSAILQVIVNVLDRGMDAQAAVDAPRVHLEEGILYAEPGADTAGVTQTVAWFRERNLFFGGCQAVEGRGFTGGGDPRRGGAVVAA
ncbi:gamma-glutamyltransferase family protein [Candidatus Solirubrobacter pratensis]|uniref:gamma-glutamyltransferase family protein n=1 Tax=Candidatus Solirubrobacter pratensis TaxID=1298857 RepID=UPI00042610D8|nr:gamma-glutamyltransferase [Candidatus Solirubrobacter pratensis]